MIKRAHQNKTGNRSINDRAYDLLGEMLLERETNAILSAIDEEKVSGNTVEMDAFFAQHDTKKLEKINRYFRWQEARTFFRKTLPKIGQVAAIMIATLTIAGGIALASSHTVRVQVMKLLISIEDQYTELSLTEDPDASFTIPADWGGDYYPSYLPGNLSVVSMISFPENYTIKLADDSTDIVWVEFSEYGESTEVNVDTEEAAVKSVTINGRVGLIVLKDDVVKICWDNGRDYFILQAAGIGESETSRIAESVTRVK